MNIKIILAYSRATECPICLDSMTLSNKQITICNHVFHEICLSQIIGNTCPLCRHKISEPLLGCQEISEQPLSPFTLQWGLQYGSDSDSDSEFEE